MTTERIDVRASLRMVTQHVVICGPDDKVEKAIRDVDAAVAELIEAANLLVAESVHPYDGGEYEDGEWIALDRARAALDRVGGA